MPKHIFITSLFTTFIVTILHPRIIKATATTTTTFSDDVTALKALKSSIKPSSIPPTSCLATWNFSTDPCTVPRITHFTCGITCSQSSPNRVVQITLDSQGYEGKLTPLVSKLTGLVTLDLGDNNFYGEIPNSISSLTNLQNLILSVNSFSGSIPPSITSLGSLQTLDLSRNSLTGSLPKDMSSLVGLTRLDLSYNKLTGPIPKLPRNLNELAIKANSLSGQITTYSFDGLSKIMTVELSENALTGTIPPWFFVLPSLQQVDLAKNSFASVIVAKPGINTQLVAVDLSYNRIEGLLPAGFGDYGMLRSLSLSYNRFRGPIPWQYSKSGTSLKRLYLDGNFLNGSPPKGLFAGDQPVTGSLGDNCLSNCPGFSGLCNKSQKPANVCQQAYGGKPKELQL